MIVDYYNIWYLGCVNWVENGLTTCGQYVGRLKCPLVNVLKRSLDSYFEPDFVSLQRLKHICHFLSSQTLNQFPFRFQPLNSKQGGVQISKRPSMKRILIFCLLGAALFTLTCKSHYCLAFCQVDGATILTFCNLAWKECKSCSATKCIFKVKIQFFSC